MPQNNLQGEFVITKKEIPKNVAEAVMIDSSTTPSLPSKHGHERSNMHFFSSLAHYPKNVVFQNQEADEDVVLVVRRDFITNVPWILGLGLAAFLPPILLVLVPIFFTLTVSASLIFLTIVFYYLILFTFAVLFFSIWYFNVGIVTNKRIVDLDVANILVRHLSEARLNSVVDVSYSQVGGIRSIFDYGNVDIQTEALHQNIEFDRAPNPNFIRKVIGELLVERPGV